jgi:hypothetical protein
MQVPEGRFCGWMKEEKMHSLVDSVQDEVELQRRKMQLLETLMCPSVCTSGSYKNKANSTVLQTAPREITGS